MKIYKVMLSEFEQQVLPIHRGAEFLDVQLQNDVLVLWYRCDPNEPIQSRNIAVFNTGQELRDAPGGVWTYLATVQMYGGSLVKHICYFESHSMSECHV